MHTYERIPAPAQEKTKLVIGKPVTAADNPEIYRERDDLLKVTVSPKQPITSFRNYPALFEFMTWCNDRYDLDYMVRIFGVATCRAYSIAIKEVS